MRPDEPAEPSAASERGRVCESIYHGSPRLVWGAGGLLEKGYHADAGGERGSIGGWVRRAAGTPRGTRQAEQALCWKEAPDHGAAALLASSDQFSRSILRSREWLIALLGG